jgi:hypothetical protein
MRQAVHGGQDDAEILLERLPAGVITPATAQSGRMIRIAITPAAFDAISATLPLGSVGYEAQTNAKGERLIWLETAFVDKLATLRGPGESYSDVILRLVEMECRG